MTPIIKQDDNKRMLNKRATWTMFNGIATTYDRMNKVMTVGLDQYWRKKMIQKIPKKPNITLLDLATGTADIPLLIAQRRQDIKNIIGLDMAETMLELGQQKINQSPYQATIQLKKGNIESIPYEDNSIDVITISFGIRNIENLTKGLDDIYRVLKPEGMVLILESSCPENRIAKLGHLFFIRCVMPMIAWMITGRNNAYRYLNKTIETFPYGEAFCSRLKNVGFMDVTATPLTTGVVTVYSGKKVETLTTIETMKAQVQACYDTQAHITAPWIKQIKIQLSNNPCIDWLAAQHIYPKLYWVDRTHQNHRGALGQIWTSQDTTETDLKEQIEQFKNLHPEIRVIGGLPFESKGPSQDKWAPLSDKLFILPALEVIQKETGLELIINCASLPTTSTASTKDHVLEQLDHLQLMPIKKEDPIYTCIHRADSPNREDWTQRIQSVLSAIKTTALEKVVMARQSQFQFSTPICPFQMIKQLSHNDQNIYQFCIQMKKDWAFIGGTPECLFHRQDKTVYTEAIAGTIKRGDSPHEDRVLEETLLTNDKDRLEHQLVLDAIKATLSTVCTQVTHDQLTSVLKLRYIQHLIYRFEGSLKDDMDDLTLVETLHPTPAVAGVPCETAKKMIASLETEGRGWYAGPIGWMSKHESEFVVAIRSGIVEGDCVTLYSGAGIVEGSEPAQEWAEIDDKIRLFMTVYSL